MGCVLGVIPARAGSKGIVGKNFRSFAGYPLIAWIAAAAKQARLLDEICVSTDAPAAAHTALGASYGSGGGRPLGIIDRSAALAGDDTPDFPVFLDLVGRLFGSRDADKTILVHLRPTAPFVRPEEIDEVVTRLRMSPADTVRSVVPACCHPQKVYLGVLCLTPATVLHRANHPRQGLLPAWRAAGFVDAHRASNLACGALDGQTILKWVAPPLRAVDLDTEHDWFAAEQLALARRWRPGFVGNIFELA